MKNFKKMMAIVIVAVMTLAYAMPMALADSTGSDQTVDGVISVTGLDNEDTVELYKVLKWDQDWAFDAGFTTIPNSAAVLSRIKAGNWTANDVAEITKLVSGATRKYSGQALNNKFEVSKPEAGLYIAIVKPKNAGVVYNPILISADYNNSNGTNTINASSDQIINTAVAKKKNVTVEKTEPKITNDVGDIYSFDVDTTIPVYSSAFSDTFFNVSDKVSEYLTFDKDSLVIKVGDTVIYDKNTQAPIGVTVNTNGTSDATFTVSFAHSYMTTLTAAAELHIDYDAKLAVPKDKLTNVTEQNNEVTVTFPNSPSDLTGKKVTALKDGTREYTFSIDGNLFGNSDYQTGELVKIGVSSNGQVLESYKELDNGSSHGVLKGAVFGLYENKTDADAGNNNYYKNTVFNGTVTTDENGLMEINGLDAGTYYLKELSAPAGYIKDSETHKIEITATIKGKDVATEGEKITEYYTIDSNGVATWYTEPGEGRTAYTYYVPVLEKYTVKVDDNATSTYTMTLSGPKISSVEPGDSSSELKNTKGVELPSTGGMGTTLFYIIGAILVILAGVLLVTRRRANAEE